MPARRNLFQDVVAIVQRHMADGALIEESASLPNRLTSEGREVDVVLTSHVGGHRVVVAVEATSLTRPADSSWVERMVGKHANLPTNSLILVSESGFTKQARSLAEKQNVTALTPVDVQGPDDESRVLGGLRSLWPKVVSFTPDRFKAHVRVPGGEEPWFAVPADVELFTEHGSSGFNIIEWWKVWAGTRFEGIAERLGLGDVAEDRDAWFTLETDAPHGIIDGTLVPLFLRVGDSDPPDLHEVIGIEVIGKAHIEVREVQLRHRRLGDWEFAQGEFRMNDKPMLLVATGDEDSGTFTVRLLPEAKAKSAKRPKSRG